MSNKSCLELHGQHLSLQVQGVIAKSIDVFDPVGSQAFQDGCVNDKSLGLNLFEYAGHGFHVVQNDQVGHQLVVLDDFALLVAHVLGNDAFAAKKQPLCELVELLALASRSMNRVAQRHITDAVQQELGANNPPELAKGKVELVLAAGRTQAAQQCRRRALRMGVATLYRAARRTRS